MKKPDIRKISEQQFKEAIDNIVRQIKQSKFDIKRIYGVPTNGLIPAVYLKHALQLPLILENDNKRDTLIVDDVVDSGLVMSKLNRQPTATVFYRKSKATVHVDFVGEFIWNDDWLLYHFENEKVVLEDYKRYTKSRENNE